MVCFKRKGKLRFFRFKIVQYKARGFNRKLEIKPIPIFLISCLPQTITSDIGGPVFRVEFDAEFHRLCYKTIGSYF